LQKVGPFAILLLTRNVAVIIIIPMDNALRLLVFIKLRIL